VAGRACDRGSAGRGTFESANPPVGVAGHNASPSPSTNGYAASSKRSRTHAPPERGSPVHGRRRNSHPLATRTVVLADATAAPLRDDRFHQNQPHRMDPLLPPNIVLVNGAFAGSILRDALQAGIAAGAPVTISPEASDG
jgi:hypothetical protein